MLFSKFLFNLHSLCTTSDYQKVLSIILKFNLKPNVLCGHTEMGLNRSQTY